MNAKELSMNKIDSLRQAPKFLEILTKWFSSKVDKKTIQSNELITEEFTKNLKLYEQGLFWID